VQKALNISNENIYDYIPELGCTLGQELLRPLKIYVKPILELLKMKDMFRITGIANITGGGFIENIPRILPDGFCIEIYRGTWDVHPIFDIIQKAGNIEEKAMYNTFNMGIGMVVSCPEKDAPAVIGALHGLGEKAYRIGKVVIKSESCTGLCLK
jgi:phosphoribosylformylglycinamidine cyclo-ligase